MKRFHKKKGLLWLGSLVLILALGFAALSCTAGATAVSANGQLAVKGTKIVNERGNAIQLRGVSTHGLAWYPQYVSYAAFKNLRDKWGVNTVRLAMYTAEYGGYCSGGDRDALKAKVREGVKAATALGMYVIIDWHVLNDTNQPFGKGGQAAAISFFKEMASLYKNYNNVLYEICNEPNGGNGGSWANVKSYAYAVIKEIRKIDKDAIIIVGTPTWCQDVDEVAKDPLYGSNLVYALHFYAGTHGESYRQKAETAIKAGLPLFVSEFGITDASGNGYVNTSEGDKWISFLDKYGISYVAWNLSNKNESSALLKSSTVKTSDWIWSDLSQSGQWLIKTYSKRSWWSTAGGTTGGSAGGTTAEKPAAPQKPATPQKPAAPQKPATPQKPASKTVKASAKYAKAKVKKTGAWSDGQRYFTQYVLTIKNKSKKNISGWKIKVKFRHAIQQSSQWSAEYVFKKKGIVIKPLDFNKAIAAKQSVTNIGFIVSSTSPKNKIEAITFLK